MEKIKLFATLLVVALCTTTVFTSCGNNDDDNRGEALEVRATNVIGNTSRVATVRAKIYDRNRDRTLTVGETSFQNNGFTLQLTNYDLPGTFLYSLVSAIESEVDSDKVNNVIVAGNISDTDAMFSDMVFFYAYDRENNLIGEFALVYENEDEDEYVFYIAIWGYADRHVSTRGIYKEIEEGEWGRWQWEVSTDMSLRRGWNLVYGRVSDTYNESTKTGIEASRLTSYRPSSANLRWEFEDWSSWSLHSESTRATERRRSILRR